MADETDIDLARVLDERGPVKRFTGPTGQKSRVIVVADKTRIPLIVLALSIAAAIGGGGLYAFQKAKLVEERRENEKRFIAVLESKGNPKPLKKEQRAEEKTAGTLNPLPIQKGRVVTMNPHPVQARGESTRSVEARTIPSITGKGRVPAFTVESSPPPDPEEAKETTPAD